MEKQILIVISEDKLNAINEKLDHLQVLIEKSLPPDKAITGFVTELHAKTLTGLSKSTLYNLRKNGRIGATTFGGRAVYYKLSDLEELLKNNLNR